MAGTTKSEPTDGKQTTAGELRELSSHEMRNTIGGIWVTTGFFERSYPMKSRTHTDDDCMSCG